MAAVWTQEETRLASRRIKAMVRADKREWKRTRVRSEMGPKTR